MSTYSSDILNIHKEIIMKIEKNKFKYETLFQDLWKESDKFEEIIKDDKRGFDTLSDDDCKVHNLLHRLHDELKFQKIKSTFNQS